MCCVLATLTIPSELASADPDGTSFRPKAALGAGRVGPLKWSTLTFSPGKPSSRHRLCLQLNVHSVQPEEIEIPLGEVACGSVHPFLNITLVDELEHPPITLTIFAVPQRAASVSLYFKGRMRDRTIPLTLLSRRKAQKTGLAPFRYFTLAFSGRSCLSRFVTHLPSGAVLENGEHMGCGFATGGPIRTREPSAGFLP